MVTFGRWIFIALLGLSGPCLVWGGKPCEKPLRTKVTQGLVTTDGSLQTPDGITYRKGTFWPEKNFWWACPCLLGPCVRQCQAELARKANLSMARQPAMIQIWEDGRDRWVPMNKYFHVVFEVECKQAFPLEPEYEPLDEFHILANGSIKFPHPNISDEIRHDTAEKYCMIPHEGKLQTVMICSHVIESTMQNLKFKIYPAFFILSAIFLLLTLLAFVLTPDHNTIHSRSVVCQSGSLLITFIGLTITYLTGERSHINVCIVVAYITYYFLLASFFWLNVMCIDIYLTFSGSMLRTHDRKFRVFSLYAWCTPLALFIVTVALDRTTKNPAWSPGIGQKSCWFQSFGSSFLYFNGPVLALLLLNSYLFGTTVWRLWKMRKETGRMLSTADSHVHKQNQHEKDRLSMYVKLFLLMGCTWFLEIISWAIGGPDAIWFVTDSINCLRGVLIFWFCVWSNKTMRQALRDKFWPKKKGKMKLSTIKPEPDASSGLTASTSAYNISSQVE
ncbi:G-protein coupled receptor Mth2-like [Neocloeon triangulifer]|uniref:G-protein coupled receptor Mth2-like n=1 Tax=Neocloeon triangulifer TaxID=2078957 RepID=UPI00286F9DC5|nr:G-protein coupled receptor Mth2-like [Neocloeon triangulifer]